MEKLWQCCAALVFLLAGEAMAQIPSGAEIKQYVDSLPPEKRKQLQKGGNLFQLLAEKFPGVREAFRGAQNAPTAPPRAPAATAQAAWVPPTMGTLVVSPEGWVHPLPTSRAMPDNPSRFFGAHRDHAGDDFCPAGHCGIDMGHTLGESVSAARDGVVEYVDPRGNGGAGLYVQVLHDIGRDGKQYVSQYMHLQAIDPAIAIGQRVDAGRTQIGRVGTTGTMSSGPHLHFVIGLKTGPGLRAYEHLNPLLFIKP